MGRHGLAIRDKIRSAEGGVFQPPESDRYPTYFWVLGPLGGKYSSVHYGASSHTNECRFQIFVFYFATWLIGYVQNSQILVHSMLYWVCSEQPNKKCSWATVTHTATSWPEHHLPGSHNAWLFCFCQVCVVRSKSSMRRLGLQFGELRKEYWSKGQLYVSLQSLLLPAIHWVFSGDQRTSVRELRCPLRGGVGSGKFFMYWGNWATSWAPHPVWIFLAYFQLKL